MGGHRREAPAAPRGLTGDATPRQVWKEDFRSCVHRKGSRQGNGLSAQRQGSLRKRGKPRPRKERWGLRWTTAWSRCSVEPPTRGQSSSSPKSFSGALARRSRGPWASCGHMSVQGHGEACTHARAHNRVRAGQKSAGAARRAEGHQGERNKGRGRAGAAGPGRDWQLGVSA